MSFLVLKRRQANTLTHRPVIPSGLSVRLFCSPRAHAQCHSICQSWLWGLPKKLSFHSPAGRVARNERGGLALGLTHVFRVDSLSPSPSLRLRPSQREDKSTFAKYKPSGIGLTPVAVAYRHFVTESHLNSRLRPFALTQFSPVKNPSRR